MDKLPNILEGFWKNSRSGAWAGRGFRFQDAVASLLAISIWSGRLPLGAVVPEGFDDIVVEQEDTLTLIQVKSRGDHRSPFTTSEIRGYEEKLKEGAKKLESAGKVIEGRWLFLERPAVTGDSLEWDSFADQGTKGESRLLVIPDPKQLAMGELEGRLEVVPSIAEIIFHGVLAFCGYVASENSHKSYNLRSRISIQEIESLISRLLKNIDPSLINEALERGLCSPVMFNDPLMDSEFYGGVDVQPGHIAAGLVMDRPDSVARVVEKIKETRSVLVVGPSGSGKSALQWMSVHELSHYMRWFRISTLSQSGDIAAILNLIEALQPSLIRPVGIVLDDVGKYDASLFQVLTKETRINPGVFFIGSIRQEDVAVLGDISHVSLIESVLDESFAIDLWEQLRQEERTTWDYWKEPYQQSKGLLLEYTHILTQGKRLEEVIKGQVADRKKQERNEELAVIRVCSAAFRVGGAVQVNRLPTALSLNQNSLESALSRLLDEHLIRYAAPGVIAGIHDIRSEVLFLYSHDELVFLREESNALAIQCVVSETLPIVIQKLVNADNSESITKSVVERLQKKPTAAEWALALTGMGIVSLRELTTSWVEILSKNSLDSAHWPMATMMACAGTEMPSGDLAAMYQVNLAVKAFPSITCLNYRSELLDTLDDSCQLDDVKEAEELIALFSSMGPIPTIGSADYKKLQFGGNISGDFNQICPLLDLAAAVDVELALSIIAGLGGEEEVLDKYYSVTPWISKPVVFVNDDGEKVVSADYLVVSDDVTENAEQSVIQLCDKLVSLVPDADKVEARAIGGDGKGLQYGDYPIASKAIPRKNLPSSAVQRWNQNFIALVANQSLSPTETDYAKLMKEQLLNANTYLKGYLEAWCRGKEGGYVKKQAAAIEQTANAANRYVMHQNLSINYGPHPIEGGVKFTEPVSSLIAGICGNLIPRLNDRESNYGSLSAFASSLFEQVEAVDEAPYWNVLDWDVGPVISGVEKSLNMLKFVLDECAQNNRFVEKMRIISKKASRGCALQLCSVNAKERLKGKLEKEKSSLRKGIANLGLDAEIYVIKGDDKETWSSDELFVAIDVMAVDSYLESFDEILSAIERYKSDYRQAYLMPRINGVYVPQFGFSYLFKKPHILLNRSNSLNNAIAGKSYDGYLLSEFDQGVGALGLLSSMINVCDLQSLTKDEGEAFDQAVETCDRIQEKFKRYIKEDDSDAVYDALVLLEELRDCVAQQKDGEIKEDSFCPNLSASSINALNGEVDETTNYIAAVRIGLVNHELSLGSSKN